jgi:uncharacterized protein YicC (UPF0701 family)
MGAPARRNATDDLGKTRSGALHEVTNAEERESGNRTEAHLNARVEALEQSVKQLTDSVRELSARVRNRTRSNSHYRPLGR